jgi:hypothetical protein
MRSTLSPLEADSHAVFPGPMDRKAQRDRKGAEEPISRLAQEIAKSHALQRGIEPSLDEAELSNDALTISAPSLGRRATRVLARFLIAAFIGIAVTLAWQSYGEDAKQIIANWAQQQLGWSISLSTTNPPPRPEIDPVAPSSTAVQAPASDALKERFGAQITPETPPASTDLQQLEAIARGLASVQQSVEKLTAGQEEMARNIARLEAAEQDVRQRVLAPSVKSTAAPARSPAQTPPLAKPAPRVSAASPPSPALPSPLRP